VLTVVGDALLRAFLTAALEDAGYAVTAAADAVAGVAAAGAAPPAVILLDLDVDRPAADGAGFAAWYRRQPEPRAPLLLLSTRSVAATVAATEAAGAAGFLRLPFALDDLLALVAQG
jgi:DNA-binding response OmpR family regulator